MVVWGGGTGGSYLNTGARYCVPISLAIGTYTGTVTLADPLATNNSQTVAVTLTVSSATPAILDLTPTSMSFSATQGTNPSSKSASIRNLGAGTLAWTAAPNKPWLQVSPFWGTTTSETDTLTVSAVSKQTEGWNGATSTTAVPSGREDHSQIWTGKEMIVWGGRVDGGGTPTNTGAKYDPASDSWTGTVTTTGAPAARKNHSGVWTGTEMIVWGGWDASWNVLNTGYRYNPSTNAWLGAISTVGAPSARRSHRAVWTGTEMLIWGGDNGTGTALNTGSRYNPTTNTWTAMSAVNAPSARWSHSAVWTGTEMIVWGGYDGTSRVNTGARYNPATDTWTGATATTSAPSARIVHSAVWTGAEMIVWGGDDGSGSQVCNTGGRYDPSSNSWQGTTTTTNCPTQRRSHQAIWTGREMVVWGGFTGSYENTGGRYQPPISLSKGTYTGTVTVADPYATGSPKTIAVTFQVTKAKSSGGGGGGGGGGGCSISSEPSTSEQTLGWLLPFIAVLISYLLVRRKPCSVKQNRHSLAR